MSEDRLEKLAMLVIATCGREEWARCTAGLMLLALTIVRHGRVGEWLAVIIWLLALAYAIGSVAGMLFGALYA